MTIHIQPVVMAGGSGTRLWPLSRSGFPKQFLALDGRDSLFQQAVQRLAGIASGDIVAAAPLVVGNEEHRFLLLEQLRELGVTASSLLLEPVGRNTAPALTLAALAALEAGDDPVLAMTPADQTVTDRAAFAAAMRRAVTLANAGAIVTLGIVPSRPETGYGYIQSASLTGEANVLAFIEKPDLQTAERYLSGGGVLSANVFYRKLSNYMRNVTAPTTPSRATSRCACSC